MEPAQCMSPSACPSACLPATISSTLQIPQPTNKHKGDVSLRGKQIRNETMPSYKPQLRDNQIQLRNSRNLFYLQRSLTKRLA